MEIFNFELFGNKTLSQVKKYTNVKKSKMQQKRKYNGEKKHKYL